MQITWRKSKRNYPEHNTPPQQDNNKKNKPNDFKLQELEDLDSTTLQYICDKCTNSVDNIVQCEWCEMWLCSDCEKVPLEVIRFTGKYSELRVHWFCTICGKLAIDAVTSHMSNQILSKEISSCLNDTVVKSLNKVVESVAKMLKETFSDLCKTLENNTLALSFTAAATEAGNRDDKESFTTSKREL